MKIAQPHKETLKWSITFLTEYIKSMLRAPMIDGGVLCSYVVEETGVPTGVLSGNTDLEKATKTLPYVDTLDETGSQRWQERVSQARSLTSVLQIATCIHVILYGLGAKLRYMGYFASLLHPPPPGRKNKLLS